MRRMAVVSTLVLVAGTGLAVAHRDLRGGANADCKVNGVWEMVSQTYKGKTTMVSTGHKYHARKIVADGYFMWLEEDLRRDTLPLKTTLDSLNYFFQQGGSGKVKVSGSSYVETPDYFGDAKAVGQPWTFTCRIDGKKWYHDQVPKTDSSISEVWEKIN
jgi:hypothetical protein